MSFVHNFSENLFLAKYYNNEKKTIRMKEVNMGDVGGYYRSRMEDFVTDGSAEICESTLSSCGNCDE